MRSMEYIREIVKLVIPKISYLFTDDIFNKLKDILDENDKNKAETISITNKRGILLRRFSDLTPKKKKIIIK